MPRSRRFKCFRIGPNVRARIKSVHVGCTVAFPMYCMPLVALLEMKVVENHETLLDRGVLVQHKLGNPETVIFVSHQWVSNDHPDPDATQFAVLQGAIRRLLDGYEVRSNWIQSLISRKDEVDSCWPVLLQNALVWYDYISVPQEARHREYTQLAIESIPAYVEMSTVTFILAPSIDHHDATDSDGEALLCDYYAWQRRGWCRLELLATHLKVNGRSPVVIRSESYIHFLPAARLASRARVAEGDFTCCALKHQRVHPDGSVSPLPCDKPALFGVLDKLVGNRLVYERNAGNLRMTRILRAYRHIWMRDLLPVEVNYNARDVTLGDFLANFEFASRPKVDGGWTPLRAACISGNVNVARQLIGEKSDIEANFKSSCKDTSMEKGTSILLHVIELCCCPEHEGILDLLVMHNAHMRSSPLPHDALCAASISTSVSKRGSRWLLRTFPDWDVNEKCVGPGGMPRWPLYSAVAGTADSRYVRDLVASKADLTLTDWPLTMDVFHTACTGCPTSSPDIAKYILCKLEDKCAENDARNSTSIDTWPVHDCVNRRLSAPWKIRMLLKLAKASTFGPTTFMSYLLIFMSATPLIGAAMEGKHRICKWLLDQKADASIVNADGDTPLSVAQKRGFTRVVDVLRDASAHQRV